MGRPDPQHWRPFRAPHSATTTTAATTTTTATSTAASNFASAATATSTASAASAATSAAAANASAPPHCDRIYRWLVDIDAWHVEVGDTEWKYLLKRCVSEDEATKVMKFMQAPDKKRALISRLLQRRACHEAFGIACADVTIERTKGGKPFLSNKPRPAPAARNWNFNVSHEGRFVALASEPYAVCGIDVAAPSVTRDRKPKPMSEQLRYMDKQFTPAELAVITGAHPDEKAMEAYFRRFWSLKEAYTKGRGDGLGFEFSRCEFTLGDFSVGTAGQPVQLATVCVDGQPLPHWRFYIQELDGGHWISVSRGPASDIVDAHGKFKASLEEMGDSKEARAALQAELQRPEPPFVLKAVAELVPTELREDYARVVASAKQSRH